MPVRAPLVETEQNRAIRIQDLPEVVMAGRRLGLTEERLIPFEADANVADADDRPCAFHRRTRKCRNVHQVLALLLPLRLSATAARMRFLRAASSILSPSCMSMARLTFPSRLALKRPEGSLNDAPLANVILTAFL